MNDVDVNKITTSKELLYGKKNSLKYFIGCNDEEDVTRPLLLRLLQMIGYLKEFDDCTTMSFRIDDSKSLKKYCKIWKKIKELLRIELGSGRVYGDGDSYVKTKIKNYDNKVNTNFQGKEVPKEDSSHKHLPLIMLDSVVKVGKKYYSQVFLEEGKYVKRKNKMINYIDDDLEMTS